MKSEEPKQTQSLRVVLEDRDIQRQAKAWAERLVQRYKLAMTGEDLYQEAMTKLVRYSNSEEPPEIYYPQAFLFTVLHNQARTMLRNQAHPTFRSMHSEAVQYDEVPTQKLSDNFDMAQRIESGILLEEVFRSLDNEQDRDLLTCVIKGYTARQIGIVFNVSHVTAAHRVTRLIKKIRKSLL